MKKYFSLINSEFILPARSGFKEASLRHPIETIKKIIAHFAADSLYRNSIYLMASTAIMAFFGFFFWIINARLYTPEQVGIATTLISVLTLISSFATLGLNVGLVRFLPRSTVRNEKINSSFTLTIIASVLISLIFLAGLKFFSPKLIFLQSNFTYMISFIAFAAFISVNTIVESIFVAYRSAKYTLLKNLVLSITKVILPLFLVVFSAYGIFASVGISNVIAFLLSIGLLVYNFKYVPKFELNIPAIKKIGSYSFGNFVATFMGALPNMVLPLIIVNKLGASEAGYFYIALMIASFLFIIPQATTQSLFAEGSYRKEDMKKHLIKSIKITSIFLLPSILVIIFLGNYILSVFGKHYSSEGFELLQLMAFSGIFVSINSILGAVLMVKNKIKLLINIGAFSAIFILGLSYLLINLGLYGIGVAWLISQIIRSGIYSILVIKKV